MNEERKALMKPFEVLGIAAAAGVFVLLIVELATKDMVLSLIFAGIAFILTLMVMALLLLSYKPNPDVPVYLDRNLAESNDPGAKGAALRPFEGDTPDNPDDAERTNRRE